jgi:hypothetical protein
MNMSIYLIIKRNRILDGSVTHVSTIRIDLYPPNKKQGFHLKKKDIGSISFYRSDTFNSLKHPDCFDVMQKMLYVN